MVQWDTVTLPLAKASSWQRTGMDPADPFWEWLGLETLWFVLAGTEPLLATQRWRVHGYGQFHFEFSCSHNTETQSTNSGGSVPQWAHQAHFPKPMQTAAGGFCTALPDQSCYKASWHILHLWAQASNRVATSASKTPPCTPLTQEAALIISTINTSESPQQRLRLPVRRA